MSQLREVIRYGMVGLVNVSVYFSVYTGIVLAGLPYPVAAVGGYLVATTLGYWLHEHWTFRGRSPSTIAWVKWLATQGSGAALNLALLAIAIDVLGAPAILAQLVLLPVAPCAMFLVGRRWVFTRAEVGKLPA
jgi:putative flippase GtrA